MIDDQIRYDAVPYGHQAEIPDGLDENSRKTVDDKSGIADLPFA